MSSSQDNDEQELSEFLNNNRLPCYVNLTSKSALSSLENNSETYKESSAIRKEQLYFYKVFESNCLFAKCYSNLIQNFSLKNIERNNNNNYEPSETNTLSKSLDLKYTYSDVVSIPIDFEGLFEVFSSNSVKHDGILDHEKDVIGLASRFTKPKNYFVAKEMKLYEIGTHNNKKIAKFKRGTICRAVKIANIDILSNHKKSSLKNYISTLSDILCCDMLFTASSNANIKKKSSDLAVEFRIIQSFDRMESNEQSVISDESSIKSNKSYYLPIYESELNKEIDLIPISSFNQSDILESNSLQIIKNLICKENFSLQDKKIDLKLFEENAFTNKKNTSSNNSGNNNHKSCHLSVNSNESVQKQSYNNGCYNSLNELIRFNQHLEIDKYLSIFEIIEFKTKYNILIGYSFNKNSLFFTPVEKINLNNNAFKSTLFSKMNDEQIKANETISLFMKTQIENFESLAKIEMSNFNKCFNKIETFFLSNNHNSGTNAADNLKKLLNPKSILHFADLVNMEWNNSIMKTISCHANPTPLITSLFTTAVTKNQPENKNNNSQKSELLEKNNLENKIIKAHFSRYYSMQNKKMSNCLSKKLSYNKIFDQQNKQLSEEPVKDSVVVKQIDFNIKLSERRNKCLAYPTKSRSNSLNSLPKMIS